MHVVKTIAIIDDSQKYRELISKRINAMPYLQLINLSDNGFDFIKYCYSNKALPDIALIDVDMPRIDGVTLSDFLTDNFPSIKKIAVSSYSDVNTIYDMFSCGVLGYVTKLLDTINLEPGINAALRDEIYIDHILNFKETIDRDALMKERSALKKIGTKIGLTKQQENIIVMLAADASHGEISDILNLSRRTVERTTQNAAEKMGVNSGLELVVKSVKLGIVKFATLIFGK